PNAASVGLGARVRAAVAALVALLSIAAVPGAAKKLAHHDNVRLIFLEHAPALADVVEIAARLSPPAPLDDAAPVEALQSGHTVDFAGRDIVLVTVDALRADHVGAYGYDRPTTPDLDALA